MAFSTGLSGLNAASQNLDVVGNNVANASTIGFKQSRAEFADVFANAVGIGTRVAAVEQQFTQGNISATNNPFDVAISGKGFFRVEDSGGISYSRNGQFHIDNSGNLVTSDNLIVTGYGADASGNVVRSAPAPLQVSNAPMQPTVTTAFKMSMNLDARATQPSTAVFDPADPTSYNNSQSDTVYDTLGNGHVFTMYFVKTATAGKWDVNATVDGTAVANVNLGAGAGTPVNLQFDSSGALTTAMPFTPVKLTVAGGGVTPLPMALDFAGSTQFGSDFAVNSVFQDGYTSGRVASVSIGNDGVLTARYNNGQTKNIGQIVLSNFMDPQGLRPVGNNRWEETAKSGLAVTGVPGVGDFGALQAGSVEESNVDLTAELVNMITAQRNYQANAQTIKTMDAVLQTLVNLR